MSAQKMLIGGQWVDSENEETSNVINPANGEVIATVPKATIQDVENCISASRTAFLDASWKFQDEECGGIMTQIGISTGRTYPDETASYFYVQNGQFQQFNNVPLICVGNKARRVSKNKNFRFCWCRNSAKERQTLRIFFSKILASFFFFP